VKFTPVAVEIVGISCALTDVTQEVERRRPNRSWFVLVALVLKIMFAGGGGGGAG